MKLQAQGKMVELAGCKAADSAAGTVSGGWIDRTGFEAARVFASLEAATGTPTSSTATLFVEDATDGSGTGADTYATLETAGADVKAGVLLQGAVNLAGARKYIRVRSTIAFVAGTTPKHVTAVGIALTGAVENPV